MISKNNENENIKKKSKDNYKVILLMSIQKCTIFQIY